MQLLIKKFWIKNDYTNFPNKEMKDIMKMVKYFEELGLFIKGFSETSENEAKEQKGGFKR